MSVFPAAAAKVDTRARVRARRATVQALYQWLLAGATPHDILNEFIAERELVHVDMDYFQQLTRNIPQHFDDLRGQISQVLNRTFASLDPVEQVILLIGAYELVHCPEVPYRVVINEAIELEKMFGAEQGHRYINTTLDKLAQTSRAVEFTAHTR